MRLFMSPMLLTIEVYDVHLLPRYVKSCFVLVSVSEYRWSCPRIICWQDIHTSVGNRGIGRKNAAKI